MEGQVLCFQVEEDAEAKRLWKEAEKAWARQDYRRAISFAEGAQLELEWLPTASSARDAGALPRGSAGLRHGTRVGPESPPTMEAVAMGVEALHSFSAPLEPHLKSLEQADFCSPLRAALLARRAQLGRGAEAEADARRALMLDANCRDAQEILRRHKQGYNNE
eukprot:g19196.t1